MSECPKITPDPRVMGIKPCIRGMRGATPWMKHSLAWADDSARKVRLGYRPAHDFTMSGGVEYIKPKARVY